MSEPNSKDTVRLLVFEFLELMPEAMKRVAYFSAIPNAITPALLNLMNGEKVETTEILQTLQDHHFINKGEGNWYYYSSDVRETLRAFWQQSEQIQEFQIANRIALAYFDELANKTKPPGNYVFQREALYHRLLEDENAGLEYMADLFEQACDQHHIGVAQNLSIQLSQTLPQLSPIAGQYASYYEMRLDFLLNRRENLEEKLELIVNEMTDLLLKARAGILLGQVWLAKYEWEKSADVLKSSLEELKKLNAWHYAARAMLALGDIYIDLVENGGGMQPESFNDFGRLTQFLTHLLFLPYLLLDWLRRKLWFFSGRFYFSGNYQEWILNYLLQKAGKWYREALGMAQKAEDDATSLNALLGQANVAVQQRREVKAQRIFSRLARLPAVQSSRYRQAQVSYGLGQVSLLANHGTRASQELQSALNTFRSFADEANIASVAHTLGTTYIRLGDDRTAAKAFLESFQAYQEIQDPLSQTQVAWELEQIVEKKKITSITEQQIKEALSTIQEKQYLVRFPSDLLHRFRILAYWVTLPLSYLLILFVSVAACLSLIAIEYSALQFSSAGKLSQFDIFWLIVVGVLPLFLAFWIIELVYAVVGQVWVIVAGRNSLNLLGEQPDRIVLAPEEILINRAGLSEPIQVAWNEIQKLVSADYRLWRRPIYLLSRQSLISGDKSIIIDGVTSGYMQIRKEITQKTSGMVDKLNADMVILAHRSTYVAALVAILHAQLLVSRGQIAITVENENVGEIPLFLSRLLVFFLVNVIMIFPPLILLRMYLQRRFFGQQLGIRSGGYYNFLHLGVTIFLTVVAILWLVVSPVLKINGDETSRNARDSQPSALLTESVFIHQIEESRSVEAIVQEGGILRILLNTRLRVKSNLLMMLRPTEHSRSSTVIQTTFPNPSHLSSGTSSSSSALRGIV